MPIPPPNFSAAYALDPLLILALAAYDAMNGLPALSPPYESKALIKVDASMLTRSLGDTSLFTKRFSSVESRVGRHQYIRRSGVRYINQNWFRIVKGYPRLLRMDERILTCFLHVLMKFLDQVWSIKASILSSNLL